VDKTWIHHYTRNKTVQIMGGSAPKKAKTVPAGKMAIVFWDSYGVMLVGYLEKGKTINGEYYAALLEQLNDTIKAKCPHLAKKKMLFYDDNASAHFCKYSSKTS